MKNTLLSIDYFGRKLDCMMIDNLLWVEYSDVITVLMNTFKNYTITELQKNEMLENFCQVEDVAKFDVLINQLGEDVDIETIELSQSEVSDIKSLHYEINVGDASKKRKKTGLKKKKFLKQRSGIYVNEHAIAQLITGAAVVRTKFFQSQVNALRQTL